MRISRKDLASGLVFILTGALFFAWAVATLSIGSAARMGPGYFPAAASVMLVVLGVAVILAGLGRRATPFGVVPWRGVALIGLGPIVFGLLVRGLGLAPTVALSCLVTCFASYRMTLSRCVAVTVVLTALSVLIFYYGIGLTIPLFGAWLER